MVLFRYLLWKRVLQNAFIFPKQEYSFLMSDNLTMKTAFKVKQQGYRYGKSEGDNDQESIQSSTSSGPEHHMGKLKNKRKHNTQESQEVSM